MIACHVWHVHVMCVKKKGVGDCGDALQPVAHSPLQFCVVSYSGSVLHPSEFLTLEHCTKIIHTRESSRYDIFCFVSDVCSVL